MLTSILAVLSQHSGLILSAFIGAIASLAGAIVVVWKAQEKNREAWHAETRERLDYAMERLDECEEDRDNMRKQISELQTRLIRVERCNPEINQQ